MRLFLLLRLSSVGLALNIPRDVRASTRMRIVRQSDAAARTPTDAPLSSRLRRARLRLAEAQGRLVPGAADRFFEKTSSSPSPDKPGDDVEPAATFATSLAFNKVATPRVAYDPVAAEALLFQQPVRWIRRNIGAPP